MNTKNDVEVIINGKQYTISGYESSDYLQRIATHINDKYAEFKQEEGYGRLDADMRNILLAINLSDDFYKAQQSIQELQKEKEDLEKEIFNMKHDMIEMKAQIDEKEKKVKELKKGKKESEHEVIRLETELKNAKTEGDNHAAGLNVSDTVSNDSAVNSSMSDDNDQLDAEIDSSNIADGNTVVGNGNISESSVLPEKMEKEEPAAQGSSESDAEAAVSEVPAPDNNTTSESNTALDNSSTSDSNPVSDNIGASDSNAASGNRNVPKKYNSSKNNRRGRRR